MEAVVTSIAVLELLIKARSIIKDIKGIKTKVVEDVDKALKDASRLLCRYESIDDKDKDKEYLDAVDDASQEIEKLLTEFVAGGKQSSPLQWLKSYMKADRLLNEIARFKSELDTLSKIYWYTTTNAQLASTTSDTRRAKHGNKTAAKSSSYEHWTDARKGTNECVAHDQEERNVLALVEYMRESADADQAEQAAWALCEMAENEKTSGPREASKWVNAVSKLVEVLEPGPKVADSTDTSVKLRRYTLYILRRLALSTADDVQTVVAGVVPLLAKMLSCTGNAETEMTAACAALADIAMQAKHKQIFLQTSDLIELLIKLVRRGSTAQKEYAANTLRELATDQECAKQIRILHGVTALIDLLYLGHSTDDQVPVCSSTLGALWNLAAHPKNRTEIAAVGGIKAIVDQIRLGRTDEQRQLAASTLAVLAKDDKNDVLIGEAGGVKVLVDLFRDGTTSGQKNSAVSALAELANNEANATAMVDAEAARPLLAAFRSGTDIERSKAGLALAWIAKFTKDKADLVAKVGLDSIINLLSGSTDEKQCSALMIAGISKDEDTQQELGKLHVIEKLIKLAQNDDDGAELMKPALDALCALSEDNDDNRVQIEDAGGIKVFVRLLSKLKQSEKGSTEDDYVHVVEALKIIASTANLKHELINADALKMFLTIMENGSMVEKQCTAAILTELMEVITEDGCDGRLESVAGAFICVLRKEEEEASQLTATVLRGLRWLASCKPGRVALRKNPDACQILVHMLERETCNTKRLVGSLLASLAGHKEFAEVLVDAGVIGAFEPLLGDEDRLLKRAGIRGLVRLASYEGLRQRIASTPRVCERIVKLLDVPTVQHRAAEALSLLASQSEIAVKFGQLDGVKELVTLLKKGTPSGKTHAMQALTNLSNAADNIAYLTKIGAIEAAIAQDAAALKFLKNMSADRQAAATMKTQKVVAKCVTALMAKDWKQRVTSLKILTNLNDFQTTSDSESDNDSDSDSGSDSDNDSDSDSYSASDDDDSDCNFLQLIIDEEGVEPLLELLSELQQGKRAELVKLLRALAMLKRSTKVKIGTEIRFFVTIIHKGTPEEQLVAAAAVTTLVKKCRKNAKRVKGEHASTAFVKLVRTHKDREEAMDLTRSFFINLESLKSAYATKVVERTVKALVSLAEDLVQGSDTARELLLDLLSTTRFDIVNRADAIAACAEFFLKEAIENKMHANSEPVETAVELLRKLVREKSCSEIVASGAVDSLVKLLKSSPPGTREEIAEIILLITYEDDSQCEAIGKLGCIQVFLEMIQSGTPGEKLQSVEVLGSLCDEHQKNVAQLLPEEMIKVCDEMLQPDDADMQYAALYLVESLAKDTSVGPLVASQEKVVKRTVALLNSEFDYPKKAIQTITALAAHSAACSVFADAGVKKKLNKFVGDELAREARKALKAIQKTQKTSRKAQ